MMCFGASNSIFSFLFGRLARYTGRLALICLGKLSFLLVSVSRYLFVLHVCPPHAAAVTNLACIITFLLWKPDPQQLYLFFLLPALWGMADAVWQPQVNGKSGATLHTNNQTEKKKPP